MTHIPLGVLPDCFLNGSCPGGYDPVASVWPFLIIALVIALLLWWQRRKRNR